MLNTGLKANFKKMIALVFLVITSIFLNMSHAADCTQKLLPTSPVIWMGEFENFRYTEEHQYGESIALWRSDACVFGYFISVAGLQGDAPMGLIENAVYEPKTGKLSFNSMLNLGMTTPDPINKPNVSIPSTDWFTVKGILTKKAFRGTVQNNSRQYYVSSEIASKKTVHLKKSNDSYYDEHQYKNYGEWQLEFKK